MTAPSATPAPSRGLSPWGWEPSGGGVPAPTLPCYVNLLYHKGVGEIAFEQRKIGLYDGRIQRNMWAMLNMIVRFVMKSTNCDLPGFVGKIVLRHAVGGLGAALQHRANAANYEYKGVSPRKT